jgi:hypothetical protein
MGKFYYTSCHKPALKKYNIVAVGKSYYGDIITIIRNITAIGDYEARNHADNLTDDIDDALGLNMDWSIMVNEID